jgi:fumarate reductase flavoprotein subunit
METDVLVAGAGAAGMVAALAAAARGAHVTLLERDAATPSNLVISGGLFAAAGTRWQHSAGVADSPARFRDDVQRKTGGAVDPRLLDVVSRNSARVAAFLADEVGLPIHLHQGAAWPGHSVARLHATPAESGAELSDLLRAAIRRSARIAFHDGAAITALAPQAVEVSAAGTRRRIAARSVILATGGFGASAALLARFCPPAAAAVHVGGVLSDGTALCVTEAFGVSLACMDAYQGQPLVSPHVIDGVRARFGAALPALGAVLVNRQGRRFVDETIGPSELTAHVLAQTGGRAVAIWDGTVQQIALSGGPFRRAVELGAVAACDDAAALAARFDMPPEAVAASLAEAARCARDGSADPTGRRDWARPLVPPYRAADVTGALAHTQGGLVVDGSARVLRTDGTAIPWLFAAGGAACGISGHGAAGYVPGNGLAQSFALGLVAGEAAGHC